VKPTTKSKIPQLRNYLLILVVVGMLIVSRGSSVSIVSGYGLNDWAIEVRSPAKAKRIFL
jgi:hypothetical protein